MIIDSPQLRNIPTLSLFLVSSRFYFPFLLAFSLEFTNLFVTFQRRRLKRPKLQWMFKPTCFLFRSLSCAFPFFCSGLDETITQFKTSKLLSTDISICFLLTLNSQNHRAEAPLARALHAILIIIMEDHKRIKE